MAAAGAEFVGVGGHTSCLAVAHDDGPWRLIIDAGTGITRVTSLLGGQPFRGTILLGHLHTDHTQGLPFFHAADRPEAEVALMVPAQGGVDAETLLDRCYSPPHFPIRIRQMQGAFTFSTIDEGVHQIEGFTVTAAEIPHGGGRTLGYRISDGRSSIAYLSDHGPSSVADHYVDALGPALGLAEGVDALLHDSQFTPAEQLQFARYGHATPQIGLDLAQRAGARRLILVHHAPRRGDAHVEQMGAEAMAAADERAGQRAVEVLVGREGLELQLP